MPFAYPILLDLVGMPCLLVGGGEVAARKARGLLAAGADSLRAVAPTFASDFPASIARVVAPYAREHLAGMRLVFAATDDTRVNRQVIRDAEAAGILANRADHDSEARGNFAVPALHRDGSLMVAVSTGHSPALSATVRDQIAADLDAGWARLADLTEMLRPRILALPSLAPADRRQWFKTLASSQALEVARARDGDVETLWNWLLQQHPRPDAGVQR